MGSLLLDILFVSAGAGVGAVGGWFLRGGSPQPEVKPPSPREPEEEQGVAQVETLMARLHQLTSSVAADIGEHSNRVREINTQLVNGADVVTIIERLVHANERTQTQLQAAEMRLQSQAREIESHVKEARTDALTRLANRRAFDDELHRCAELYRRSDVPFSVMMMDVDHFKKFNDTYGHQAGDEVLKGVARVLRCQFAENETVCRYGGEEFAVIFPSLDLEAAILRAESGRAAIGQEVIEYDGLDLKVTVSGGLAETQPDETCEQLVKRADDSLYVSKSKGRNRGFWHDGRISHPMKDFVPGTAASSKFNRSDEDAPPDINNVFRLVRVSEDQRPDNRIAGLSDRDTFGKDLERRLAEQQRRNSHLALMLVRIDDYSDLIKDYGEKAAELAVRAAAQILKVTKREMDHAGRVEDDTFCLLLPGAELAEARAAAERVRLAIEKCTVPVNSDHLQFTVSVGVSCTLASDVAESALQRVERVLKTATTAGGNCIHTSQDVDESQPALANTSINNPSLTDQSLTGSTLTPIA